MMMIRGAGVLVGVVALTGGVLVGVAPSIQAGMCAKQTGGSNDRVMWTGSGYTCAYTADNGDNKIGAFATEVWTSSTAPGYEKRFKCQRNSGGVSISSVYTDSAGTGIGSSITFTAFNTKDGSRHWTGAVLWNTPQGGEGASSQFRGDCEGYTVKSNLFYVPTVKLSGPTSVDAGGLGSYEVAVTTPDGGGPATGAVSLFHQATVDQQDPNPPAKSCDGSTRATTDILVGQATLVDGKATISNWWYGPSQYRLYAVYGGMPLGSGGIPPYCAAPPVSGLTAGISNTLLLSAGISGAQAESAPITRRADTDAKASKQRIQVVDARAIAPALPLTRCRRAWAPMQSNVSSPTAVISQSDLKWTAGGAKLRSGSVPKGTQVDLQTVCRPRGAPAVTAGAKSYGSRWADEFTSRSPGSVILAGMGDDELTVRHRRTVAMGGVGADGIVVRAKRSAANGGPGPDELFAASDGPSLIVGGSGQDQLVGAKGVRTRINSADGDPGDRVVCHGQKNQVLADRGDLIIGNCIRVQATP